MTSTITKKNYFAFMTKHDVITVTTRELTERELDDGVVRRVINEGIFVEDRKKDDIAAVLMLNDFVEKVEIAPRGDGKIGIIYKRL